ncbi:protease inhibitor I42 family protein [bacterium]|nr:protease inhibitor I42 family protein [bacterium]
MNAFMASTIRLFVSLACLMLITLTVVADESDQPPQPKEMISITTTVPASSKQAIPIAANAGSEFAITLDSNATTGYQWRLGNQPDEKIVKSMGSVYNEPKSRLMGAGGTEAWTFQAAGKGTTQIVLEYARPWEKDIAPIKTQTFTVTVQ